MTVSCRRSAKDVEATIAGDSGAPAASAVPQLAPKFASGELPWPYDGHARGSGAPHWMQNLLPSGLSALQFGQTMPHLCSLERVKESLIDVVTMAERRNPVTAETGCPASPGRWPLSRTDQPAIAVGCCTAGQS
jgi:hypothetical protein